MHSVSSWESLTTSHRDELYTLVRFLRSICYKEIDFDAVAGRLFVELVGSHSCFNFMTFNPNISEGWSSVEITRPRSFDLLFGGPAASSYVL